MDKQIFDQVGNIQPSLYNRSKQGKRDMGMFLHGVDLLSPLQALGFGSTHANEGMKMKKMKKKKIKKLQRLAYVVYHAKEGSRRQIDAAIAYLNLCAKGRGTCDSI